jgi:hypothetical protein
MNQTPWRKVLLENFSILLTRAYLSPLSWAKLIQSTHSYPISIRLVFILFSHLHQVPSVLFPTYLPTETLYAFLVSHVTYMSHSSHSLWFDHPSIGWRVQLASRFAVFSCLLLFSLNMSIYVLMERMGRGLRFSFSSFSPSIILCIIYTSGIQPFLFAYPQI